MIPMGTIKLSFEYAKTNDATGILARCKRPARFELEGFCESYWSAREYVEEMDTLSGIDCKWT